MQSQPSKEHPFYLLSILLIISLSLVMACSGKSSDAIKQISVSDLKTLLDKDSTLKLVDVRTVTEYNTVRVPHIKARIDFQEIADLIDTTAFPKDQPVYLICRTGRRSLVAAKELKEAGYQQPINVKGGTMAWEQSGYPVIKH